MAAHKKKVELVQATPKYKGSQILRMTNYNNRIARVVINEDEWYTLEEVDALVSYYLKKKG